MNNVYRINPSCPACEGLKVTLMNYGGTDYKKCTSCPRLSPIEETDELTLIEEE